MKTEHEIAIENVEKYLKLRQQENEYNVALQEGKTIPLKGTFELNDLEIEYKTHKQTCQRFLEFLKTEDKFYGSEDKLIDLHLKLEKKITDLNNTINEYKKVGI